MLSLPSSAVSACSAWLSLVLLLPAMRASSVLAVPVCRGLRWCGRRLCVLLLCDVPHAHRLVLCSAVDDGREQRRPFAAEHAAVVAAQGSERRAGGGVPQLHRAVVAGRQQMCGVLRMRRPGDVLHRRLMPGQQHRSGGRRQGGGGGGAAGQREVAAVVDADAAVVAGDGEPEGVRPPPPLLCQRSLSPCPLLHHGLSRGVPAQESRQLAVSLPLCQQAETRERRRVVAVVVAVLLLLLCLLLLLLPVAAVCIAVLPAVVHGKESDRTVCVADCQCATVWMPRKAAGLHALTARARGGGGGR